ncbi:hypothetical protein DMJ13_21880 [halophilic archaeon]|nr:hypothetical protein DMJ13_21880 [halophilic archaeon]
MFEPQFESPASTDMYVRLVGQSSSECDAVYITTDVMDDGEEQSVTAGECPLEAETMEITEELLHFHQQSIRVEARTLDELDAETLEAIVGLYRYGKLRYRLRTLLDTFQHSQATD